MNVATKRTLKTTLLLFIVIAAWIWFMAFMFSYFEDRRLDKEIQPAEYSAIASWSNDSEAVKAMARDRLQQKGILTQRDYRDIDKAFHQETDRQNINKSIHEIKK